jgi:uracil phosphoribosyltransferase
MFSFLEESMSLIAVDHPLVQHKVGLLRNLSTSTQKFRQVSREITNFLTYEATRDLPLETSQVQGWAGPVGVRQIMGKKIAVVPILRAGMGIVQGVLDLIPSARVNVLGMYRNEETLKPVVYFKKFSADIASRIAIILDPMLATGGSFLEAVDILHRSGCSDIRGICLIAAPEGVRVLEEAYPHVPVYTASLDERLDENGYILPGLGDAGDRLFGTK